MSHPNAGTRADLRRFPGLALAVPYEDVAFRSHHFIYGLLSLPVRW
ncbi:hypothetical protein AB0L13_10355 [Saccharopolyspora shandongensis]